MEFKDCTQPKGLIASGASFRLMLKVEEYRKEAENCRRMAAKETNRKVMAGLLELAQRYEALAESRRRFLALHEEIRTKSG